MNPRLDQVSCGRARQRKISTIGSTRFITRLVKQFSRPGFAAITFAALLLVTASLGFMASPGRSVNADIESINTHAADCTNPQPNNSWNLGGTICATAAGAPQPSNGFRQRRFQWVTPNGSVAQQTDITADPQNDTYTVPTSGFFSQVGTWRVQTVDNDGGIFSEARFILRDPATASADLAVNKFGPIKAAAGSNITYTVIVTNQGPDDAQSVVLTDPTPADMTFVSQTQVSGPAFTCGNPGTTTTCTISTLAANDSATFSITYSLAAGTPEDTVISNTASVSSATNELFQPDNSSSFDTTVTGVSTTCTLNCPASFTVDNDPNQCTAVVTYSTATTSGNCGSPPDSDVTCNPPSGSTFPVGATVVSCSTQSGGSCSFTVTVHDTRPPVQPTINCPSNVSVGEDSPDSGEATVNYASPTSTGNCVTAACEPLSGSRFVVGTTTVHCTATDSSNNTVSCSFTVTVTSGAACTVTCPGDVTQSAPAGQCSAVVTYAAPTTSGNCGTVTCDPASGSTFPVGSTAVSCSSSQGPSCSFLVTVLAPAPPTIVTCASNKSVAADANCEGVIPNLLPEVVTTGCSVTKSQSPAAGSVVSAGIYTVTITAENSEGLVTCTATVTVDNQPPTIACPANVSVTAALGQTSAAVSYSSPTATDNCSSVVVACVPPSGSTFSLGVTTVSCTATDGSSNQSSCSFKVAVSGTLLANADSFLRDGADNTNEGANDTLRIQNSGNNRVLVRFNTAGIPTAGLQSATLKLNIVDNSDNWGPTGRLVDAQRLLADWSEGNGHTVGSQPNFRGTGEGVTWKCAKDANIANQNDDCITPWNGGTFAAATAASVLHTNGQMGEVDWTVTADVIASAGNGWLIKKQAENQNGQVKYYSREGAATAGNSGLGPRLVLVYQP